MISAEQINQAGTRLVCDLLNQSTLTVQSLISYVETGTANPSVSKAIVDTLRREAPVDPTRIDGIYVRGGLTGRDGAWPSSMPAIAWPQETIARAEIAEAIELPKMTIANSLEKLLDAGLFIADPPREVAVHGQRIRYTVRWGMPAGVPTFHRSRVWQVWPARLDGVHGEAGEWD